MDESRVYHAVSTPVPAFVMAIEIKELNKLIFIVWIFEEPGLLFLLLVRNICPPPSRGRLMEE